MRQSRVWHLSTLVVVVSVSGCATSASRLKLSDVKSDEAAFFGHLEVANRGSVITGRCYAEFTGQDEKRKVYTSLDDTGWVFLKTSPGAIYLSKVLCNLGLGGGLIDYTTRDLKFEIPGGSRLAYFGHVTVEMDGDTSAIGVLVGGGLIAGTSKDAGKEIVVESRLEDGIQEYNRRYAKEPSTMKVVSIAPSRQVRLPASAK